MYAAALGDIQIETWKDTVELLINNGADINSKNDAGISSISCKNTAMACLLLYIFMDDKQNKAFMIQPI